MENNELTLLELNEGVSSGWMQPRPHDGDALNREAAAELGVTLRSIVLGAAGPKFPGTAWVEVLPDLTRWQGDVLNAAAVALPQGARMTISPRRKQ